MSEIDVSKYKNCPYWHYGHCQNNIINVLNSECSVHQNCFIKKTLEQFQQVKADSERLCTAIRNELHDQYEKRVSEAESDIAWGVLDRNATEAEFCKKVIFETRNYITKLKAENEGLQSLNDFNMQKIETLEAENDELKEQYKLAEPLFQACKIKDLKIDKYKTILDEIEELCKEITKEDICVECNHYETQDRCYECDYEHHRQELYYKRTKYNMALDILQLIKQAKEN